MRTWSLRLLSQLLGLALSALHVLAAAASKLLSNLEPHFSSKISHFGTS
jgi:hypothetical protein